MCDICGDEQHELPVSRRHFLRTGALAALAPWAMGAAFAADPPGARFAAATERHRARGRAEAPAGRQRALRRQCAKRARLHIGTRGARAGPVSVRPVIPQCGAEIRVLPPELLFDQGPGDLFVMRVAGNIVSPDLLASIEYGVQFLGVPLIMAGAGSFPVRRRGRGYQGAEDQGRPAGSSPDLITGIKPAVIVAERTRPATFSTTPSPRMSGARWRGSRIRRRSCRRPTLARRSTSSAASTTSLPAR